MLRETKEATSSDSMKVSVDAQKEQALLSETLRSALEVAEGRPVEAARFLEEAAKKDPRLYQEIIPESMLRDRCWYIVRQAMMQKRANIWHQHDAEAYTKENGSRVYFLAQATAGAFFSFPLPLPGQPPLGDAMKEQLNEAVKFYLDRARDMSAKGRFLSLIADKLPEGKRVREKFTEKKLQELHKTLVEEELHAE